jgi:hypothetical protein
MFFINYLHFTTRALAVGKGFCLAFLAARDRSLRADLWAKIPLTKKFFQLFSLKRLTNSPESDIIEVR